MGLGKILGMAVLGVGAVAAAPFTGGGSILGAASLGASLAGAGAAATGAGVVGAGIGAAMSDAEEQEEERKRREIAQANMKAENATKIVNETKEHYQLIIALTALGVSMANIDGEISPEEMDELNEFVGGLAHKKYPQHVVDSINKILRKPPSFNEAMEYLKGVEEVEYPEIRNLLVVIMESDEKIHPKEKAFLSAYDSHIEMMAS